MNEKGIAIKNELVSKAKELAEKAEDATFAEINDLKKKWRRASSEDESLAEKELNDKFDEFMSAISSKAGEVSQTVEETKNQIIKEAKEISTKSYKEADKKMEELMERWKAAGRAGQEKDDELWAEFKEARIKYREDKKNYFENLKETFAKNKEEKEKLIEEATKANEGSSFKEIGTKMDELMESWKKIGSAGKDFEDDLWNKFSNQRKAFYKKRKEYYKGMKETYSQRAEQKKELIAQAKQYLARSEFTEDEVAAVKELRNKWREIGTAGKENEDTLWNEFNGIENKYFDELRFYIKNK